MYLRNLKSFNLASSIIKLEWSIYQNFYNTAKNTGKIVMIISPRVFISYSHDSEDHKNWVINLATRLRNDGVEAILDYWHIRAGDDLTAFMEDEPEKADFIIVVCSKDYNKKIQARKGGSAYEKSIIASEQIRDMSEDKIIPIIRNNTGSGKLLPRYLNSKLALDFRGDSKFESEYNELLVKIYDQNKAPHVGSNPFEQQTKEIVEESNINKSFKLTPEEFVKQINEGKRNFSGLVLVGDKEIKAVNLENINFSNADLSGARFIDCNLKWAKLINANLNNTEFMRSNFWGADLHGANLVNANISGANLTYANLVSTNLKSANLTMAMLPGANLWGTIADGANISGANLTYVNFTRAKLNGANLSKAKLPGCNFWSAELIGANLSDAILENTVFTLANLSNATIINSNLQCAILRNANLIHSNLAYSNFRGSNLCNADLTNAVLVNTNFWKANMIGTNLANVNLMGAYMATANLYSANLEGADLMNTNLYHTNLFLANLINVKNANLQNTIK